VTPDGGSPRRARRLGPGIALALAIAGPAAGAGALALHLSRPDEPPRFSSRDTAPALARIADLTPARELDEHAGKLRPVIARPGRAGLRVDRLEPLSGGIRPAPPARVEIASAELDAQVEPVQATATGIEVPAVDHAGWFDGGARPGEPGRAVLIGHLDSSDGPGIFARVPAVSRGDAVRVTDNRGDVHPYRVVGVATVRKSQFPGEAVYGPSRRPVLVLVTCGGPYEKGRGYRDNVLVYARAA